MEVLLTFIVVALLVGIFVVRPLILMGKIIEKDEKDGRNTTRPTK